MVGDSQTGAQRPAVVKGMVEMERLARDLRFALRSFRRTPTFALAAVLILGLGIGMAVAMFTVSTAVLVQPLPVHDQGRIVLPRTVDPRGVDLALMLKDLEALRRIE